MEMSKSDVLDKTSILGMKARYDAALLPMYQAHVASSARIIKKGINLEPVSFVSALMKLIESNAKIWALEATIRNEFKLDPANQGKELSFEEIGRAAISIREHNAMRVEAKAVIDRIFNQIPEPKVDHISSTKGVIVPDDYKIGNYNGISGEVYPDAE